MSQRGRRIAGRLVALIPACWLWMCATAPAQSPDARRQRFIEMLMARQDRMASEMLERQVRRTEARIERLSQIASTNPRLAAATVRSLAFSRRSLEVLKDQAQSPQTPIRRMIEAQIRRAEASLKVLNARLERLIQQGTRPMGPRQARLYQRSLDSLRTQIEAAVEQRDFLERAVASPTTPSEVASSSLTGL